MKCHKMFVIGHCGIFNKSFISVQFISKCPHRAKAVKYGKTVTRESTKGKLIWHTATTPVPYDTRSELELYGR